MEHGSNTERTGGLIMNRFSRRSAVLQPWLVPALVCILSIAPAHSGEPRAPLPPLNAKVAEFVRSHLGEPVGDGICITLAVEALRAAGAKPWPLSDPAGEYAWGEPIPDLKDVMPGDILQFRDAVFSGSRTVGGNRRVTWHETYPHHTAVVVGTEEKGRLITIYHQNVATKGEDPSKVGNVRSAVLRMNSLQKGGSIRAYRPVPVPVVGIEDDAPSPRRPSDF